MSNVDYRKIISRALLDIKWELTCASNLDMCVFRDEYLLAGKMLCMYKVAENLRRRIARISLNLRMKTLPSV